MKCFTLLLLGLFGVVAFGEENTGDERWAYEPLIEASVPAVADTSWARNPIDHFILAKLEAQQLRPQPAAKKHTLIRRLSFALTGLAPTPEQVEAFVTEEDPQAYQQLIERLLTSPHYGERWARHWLDAARFGESDGTLTVNNDKIRGDAWKYRDATIAAFNVDLPWDEFVRYQFIDPPAQETQYSALRQFIHLGTRLQNNADPNDKQFHRLDDMVATTGNAFLGVTFGCARCHDHPVDPMSTKEYYQFTALFFDQVKEEPKASKKKIALEITEPRILKDGNWSSPGAAVGPGFLQALMRQPAEYWLTEDTTNLSALAQWLTDIEHGAGQQLARVVVNRLWHHHFGRGLVATPNDFGTLGSRPSHPQLLDWLAQQLIDQQWRLKPIQRLIVDSATYRQAHAADNSALESDSDNVWLWQRRPQRLEAEAVRDHLLFVAGKLDPKMGGKSIYIGAYKKTVKDTPDKWRRSIYLQAHRTVRHPTLGLFDPPDRERSEDKRSTGSSPSSALFALNSPLVWQLAEHFAQRVREDVGSGDAGAMIQRAYMIALSRPPSAAEIDIAHTILRADDAQSLIDYCHLLMGLNEMIYID